MVVQVIVERRILQARADAGEPLGAHEQICGDCGARGPVEPDQKLFVCVRCLVEAGPAGGG